jgi:hypothetical protein
MFKRRMTLRTDVIVIAVQVSYEAWLMCRNEDASKTTCGNRDFGI